MPLRLPSVYVTHGGGPMPLLGDRGQEKLTRFLKDFPSHLPRPETILLVTAHWEERVPTVSTAERPTMLYDYYGFPPEAYEIKYNAPGSPRTAARVTELLRKAGIPCDTNADRGFDHGTFVPLKLMYPEATVPVVQMSLAQSLDPKLHIDIGRALAPLRDEGVLIIASGSSFHNMKAFMRSISNGGTYEVVGKAFDDYLQEACGKLTGDSRRERLEKWSKAPGALEAHPREEHLLPLMVAAGAALDEPGAVAFSDVTMGAQLSAFVFGEAAVAM